MMPFWTSKSTREANTEEEEELSVLRKATAPKAEFLMRFLSQQDTLQPKAFSVFIHVKQ